MDAEGRVCIRAAGDHAQEVGSLTVRNGSVLLLSIRTGALRVRLDGRLRLRIPRWVARVVGLAPGDRVAIARLPSDDLILASADRLAVHLSAS